MRQLFSTIWWWLRVLVLVVVVLYALALLWNNSKQVASIWYWPGRPAEETNIMAFGLAAFLSGGLIMTIGWALFTATVNLRRTRAARKKRAAIQQREEMERKAAMLRVKPAPAPVIRSKPEPNPVPARPQSTKSTPTPTPPPTSPPTHEADPVPAVEVSPEGTLSPAPVVIRPVVEKPEVVTAVRKEPTTPAPAPGVALKTTGPASGPNGAGVPSAAPNVKPSPLSTTQHGVTLTPPQAEASTKPTTFTTSTTSTPPEPVAPSHVRDADPPASDKPTDSGKSPGESADRK